MQAKQSGTLLKLKHAALCWKDVTAFNALSVQTSGSEFKSLETM